MIVLDDLSAGRRVPILTSVNAVLPSDRRIALLGRSARDKKLFIEILAGIVLPSKGRVVRNARLSFPVGRLPGFDNKLSVKVNAAHVARLYGADVRQVLQIVGEAFRDSGAFEGAYANMPGDLRKLLPQVLAFALPFDTYLLTDHTQHPAAARRRARPRGDNFHAVWELLFQHRAQTSGIIIPTNDLAFVREHCDMAVRIEQGRVDVIENLKDLESQSGGRGRRRLMETAADSDAQSLRLQQRQRRRRRLMKRKRAGLPSRVP